MFGNSEVADKEPLFFLVNDCFFTFTCFLSPDIWDAAKDFSLSTRKGSLKPSQQQPVFIWRRNCCLTLLRFKCDDSSRLKWGRWIILWSNCFLCTRYKLAAKSSFPWEVQKLQPVSRLHSWGTHVEQIRCGSHASGRYHNISLYEKKATCNPN